MSIRLSKSNLLQRVLSAARASGWNPIPLGEDHPFRIALARGESQETVLCYIWNLTYGGYPRDPNELRIQITGVDRFSIQEGVKTIVVGWSETDQIFVGFDVAKHLLWMQGRSPSFQIRRETVTAAAVSGFCPQLRGNLEIAIAFRPDFFGAYVQELESLHAAAQRAEDLQSLQEIAAEPADHWILDIPPGPRRVELQQIQRKIRDQRFRKNVLSAYHFRCAMSGIQLDLLDAAHLIPVEHVKGTDETKNGICLSAIHHRAFDQGLLGIRKDYSIVFNDRRLNELKSLGWHDGIDLFKSTLRQRIILPVAPQLRPDPDYLVFGQSLRGWTRRALI